MRSRTHAAHLVAAAALAATMLAAPTTATAAPDGPDARVRYGAWDALTNTASPNTAEVTVARTADGLAHLVWLVEDATGKNYEHTTISPSGSQGPVTRVFATSWSQLTHSPDLGVNSDGSLRLAFMGSVDGSTGSFFSYKGIYSAVSTNGGATWTVPSEVLAQGSTGVAGGATLAFLPDGTTIAGTGDTGGFHWHVGAIPAAAEPTATDQAFTDHAAMAPSLVASGGAVLVVYQDTRSNSVFARQVWPTLGAPLRAPGTHTIPGQPIAVVDRPGVGPVAALEVDNQVVLWDIAANRTHRARGMRGPNNVALTALPDGHLWVAAQGPIGFRPRVARVAASGWDVDRRPTLLDDIDSSFGVALASASPTRAEVILTANESGSPVLAHARSARAQLTVEARPRRWRIGQPRRVVFKVTDVDGNVRGAKVRAAGRRCTTNGAGKCAIRFPAVNRPRQIRVKVTRAGYDKVQLRLKVRRR